MDRIRIYCELLKSHSTHSYDCRSCKSASECNWYLLRLKGYQVINLSVQILAPLKCIRAKHWTENPNLPVEHTCQIVKYCHSIKVGSRLLYSHSNYSCSDQHSNYGDSSRMESVYLCIGYISGWNLSLTYAQWVPAGCCRSGRGSACSLLARRRELCKAGRGKLSVSGEAQDSECRSGESHSRIAVVIKSQGWAELKLTEQQSPPQINNQV